MAKNLPNITKIQGKNGKIRWQARAKIGRKDIQKTFDYLEDAQRWKREIEDSKSKKQSTHLDAKNTTFNEIYDYAMTLSRDEFKKSNLKNLPRLRKMNGVFTIQSLNQGTLTKFIQRLLAAEYTKGGKTKQIKGNTMRRYFFTFKIAVKRWARAHDYELGLDWEYDLPEAWQDPRDVRVRDEDLEKFYAATNTLYTHQEDWVQAIKFFINTALRKQELFLIEWSDIQSSGRTLKIRKEIEKTRRERLVPLNEVCREILEDRASKYGKEGRIFGTFPSLNAMGQQFGKYLRKNAGLKHMNIHDFRHEAIFRMVATGAPVALIMKATGHTDFKTFSKYLTVEDGDVPSDLIDTRLTT